MTKKEQLEFIHEVETKYSSLFDEVDRFVSTLKSNCYTAHLQKLLIESIYALARTEREKRLK